MSTLKHRSPQIVVIKIMQSLIYLSILILEHQVHKMFFHILSQYCEDYQWLHGYLDPILNVYPNNQPSTQYFL